MNKFLLTSLVASTLLLGCGDDDLPQECLDMAEAMEKIAEKQSTDMPGMDSTIEQMEEDWAKMSSDEREKTVKDCKMANEMFKMIGG